MCGITGAFTTGYISEAEVRNVQKLMMLNSYRGEDSSGIFDFIEPKKDGGKFTLKESAYHKSLAHPAVYALTVMEDQIAGRWKQPNRLKMVSCHARAATQGNITVPNAHPFNAGSLTGIHNGTISGKFDGREKYETDSEALYNVLAERGVEEGLNHIVEKSTNAAYALAFFDRGSKTFYMIRNSQRPLSYLERGNVYYYSSDRRDLAYTFKLKDDSPDIKDLEVNTLYSMKLDTHAFKMKEEKISIKTKVYHSQSYGNNFNQPWSESSEWTQSLTLPPYRGPAQPGVNNVVHFSGWGPITYKNGWSRTSLAEIASRGKTEKNTYAQFYDICTKTWYSDFQFSMLQYWKQEHKQAYLAALITIWKKLSDDEQRKELLKCHTPPVEISLSKKGNKYIIWTIPDKVITGKPDVKVDSETGEVTDVPRPFGVNGQVCSTEHYKTLLCKQGCSNCASPVPLDEKVFWLSDTDFLCNTCQWEAYTSTEKGVLYSMVDTGKLGDFLNE